MAKAYSDAVIHTAQDWQEEQRDRALRLLTAGVQKLVTGGMPIEQAIDEAERAALLQVEADILRAFKAGGMGAAP